MSRTPDYLKGAREVLAIVAEYDAYSMHPHRISECAARKLNLPGARRPRLTPPLTPFAKRWLLAELQKVRP